MVSTELRSRIAQLLQPDPRFRSTLEEAFNSLLEIEGNTEDMTDLPSELVKVCCLQLMPQCTCLDL